MEEMRRPESAEKEPRTRILALETHTPHEGISEYILLEVPQGFDVQAAKEEFDQIEKPPVEGWPDPAGEQEQLKDWLIKRGLAKEVDVERIQEDIMM